MMPDKLLESLTGVLNLVTGRRRREAIPSTIPPPVSFERPSTKTGKIVDGKRKFEGPSTKTGKIVDGRREQIRRDVNSTV